MSNATAASTWSKKRRCGMGAEVSGVCAIVLTMMSSSVSLHRRQAWQAQCPRSNENLQNFVPFPGRHSCPCLATRRV